MTLNERFTKISEVVSEALGHYLFTIISLIVLVIWVVYGALVLGGQWFTSQEWNFPLNTITTVGEWFIGALVAAAANRVERRNRALAERELGLQEEEKKRSVEQRLLLEVVKDHTEASKRFNECTLQLLEILKGKEDRELKLLRDKFFGPARPKRGKAT